jgi:hypothetical protein
MTCALTKTVGSYSSGTRVELLNYTKANTAFVSVIATKEVLEITQDELVVLRSKTTTVKFAEENHKQRYRRLHPEKAIAALANEAQRMGIY